MNAKIKFAITVQTFVAIVTNASVMDVITIIKALVNK
jgi:hypothetical protein